MDAKIIWFMLFVGSTIGSFVPLLWGDDLLSFWSVIFTGIGGLVGIWIGYRMTR